MAVTDDFNRADGALGANWTTSDDVGLVIATNRVIGGAGGPADYSASHWSAVSFNATQTSVLTKPTGFDYVGPGVRHATGGNWYGYFSHGSLQKAVGGTVTIIGSPSAASNGQILTIEVSGTTLTMKLNGTPDAGGTVTDASLSAGAPGVVGYDVTGPGDDWQGTGEIAAGNTARLVFRKA